MSPADVILRLFIAILQATWQAAVLAILIIVLQQLLPRAIGPRWRCVMWALVFIRLAVPALPESRWSLFNLVQQSPAATPTIVMPDQIIRVDLGSTVAPTAAGVPAATQSSTISGYAILAAIWLSGVVFVIGRGMLATVSITRRIRRGRVPENSTVLEELRNCCDTLHVRRLPRLIEVPSLHSPALYGIVRPVLLIPAGLMDHFDPRQRRFVLLHELVHLKSHDVLIGTIAWVLNAIHWFNPVLWYAATRFRADREVACDARVLQITDRTSAAEYGQTILTLLETAINHPLRHPGAAAMLGSRSSVHRRILQITNPHRPGHAWSFLALLLVLGIASVTLTRAQSPSSSATREPLIINVFDIRDLIVDRNYGDPGPEIDSWPITSGPSTNATVQASSGGPTTSSTRQRLVDAVIKQIQAAVDPTGWSNDGPPLRLDPDPADLRRGIREASGQLIIRQTQSNLDAINKMLTATREEMSRQVTVETRFITGEQILNALNPDGKWINQGDGIEVFSELLDDFQVNLLIRASQAGQDSTTLTAPRLTLFDKQRARVAVSTDTAFVADIKITPDGKQEPIVKVVQSGIVMDIRGEIHPDTLSTTLTLHPRLSRLRSLVASPWPAPPAPRQAYIQVPVLDTVDFTLTTDIADGQSQLIRARYKHTPGPPDAALHQQVYILVRPRLILQREAEPAPTTQPR